MNEAQDIDKVATASAQREITTTTNTTRSKPQPHICYCTTIFDNVI
jgi:hypothetical protein